MDEHSVAFDRSTTLLSAYEAWCFEKLLNPYDVDSAIAFAETELLDAPLRDASAESLRNVVSELCGYIALALMNEERWAIELERRRNLTRQLELTKPRPRGRPKKPALNPLLRLVTSRSNERKTKKPGAPKKPLEIRDIDEVIDAFISAGHAQTRLEAASLIAKLQLRSANKHSVGQQLNVVKKRFIRLDREARKVKESLSKIDD